MSFRSDEEAERREEEEMKEGDKCWMWAKHEEPSGFGSKGHGHVEDMDVYINRWTLFIIECMSKDEISLTDLDRFHTWSWSPSTIILLPEHASERMRRLMT